MDVHSSIIDDDRQPAVGVAVIAAYDETGVRVGEAVNVHDEIGVRNGGQSR